MQELMFGRSCIYNVVNGRGDTSRLSVYNVLEVLWIWQLTCWVRFNYLSAYGNWQKRICAYQHRVNFARRRVVQLVLNWCLDNFNDVISHFTGLKVSRINITKPTAVYMLRCPRNGANSAYLCNAVFLSPFVKERKVNYFKPKNKQYLWSYMNYLVLWQV